MECQYSLNSGEGVEPWLRNLSQRRVGLSTAYGWLHRGEGGGVKRLKVITQYNVNGPLSLMNFNLKLETASATDLNLDCLWMA